MKLKRLLLFLILGLFLYLGLYSWNQRTGTLDHLTEYTGLEAAGYVLGPCRWVADNISEAWKNYIYLVDTRKENAALRRSVDELSTALSTATEDREELLRLRNLLSMGPPDMWRGVGARVIANRLGPAAALVSITLDKGFLNGAQTNTPVTTPRGLVGRVLRASPHSATVLLITDPNSRVAVLSQNGRVPGILSGTGDELLEIGYVPPYARIQPGEIFITSGQDGIFPKGIPCAKVIEARQSDTSPFQMITAAPLVAPDNQEEVLLLQPPTPGQRIPHVREGPYGLGGKLPPIVPDIMPREVLPENLLLREYEGLEQQPGGPASP